MDLVYTRPGVHYDLNPYLRACQTKNLNRREGGKDWLFHGPPVLCNSISFACQCHNVKVPGLIYVNVLCKIVSVRPGRLR